MGMCPEHVTCLFYYGCREGDERLGGKAWVLGNDQKGPLGNDQKPQNLLTYHDVSPSDKNQHLSFNLYIYNFEKVVGRHINEFLFKSN